MDITYYIDDELNEVGLDTEYELIETDLTTEDYRDESDPTTENDVREADSTTEDDFDIQTKRPKTFNDQSTDTTIQTTKINKEEDYSDLEDADGCPICFEPWTSGGIHRVSSLKCGHLFGKHCIETWLSTSGRTKCPQCNIVACKKDIRILFVKNLKVMDTSERDMLAKELEKERMARKKAEELESQVRISYNVLLAELNFLKESVGNNTTQSSIAIRPFDLQGLQYCSSINFGPESACKSIDFDSHLQNFALGMFYKAPHSEIVGRHGIGKVSLLDTGIDFLPIHENIIKSIACSPHKDGTVLTASFDKTLKLSSLHSNSCLLTYNLPASGWCCSFNPKDRNIIFVGQSQGMLSAFDIRNTSIPLWSKYIFEGGHHPIHSINIHSSGSEIFIASSQGVAHIILNSSSSLQELSYPIHNDCSSMTLCEDFSKLLMSRRGSQAEHRLYSKGGDKWTEEQTYKCKYPQGNMVKSSIHTLPDTKSYLMAMPDGPSVALQIFGNQFGSFCGPVHLPPLNFENPNVLQCIISDSTRARQGVFLGLMTQNHLITYM